MVSKIELSDLLLEEILFFVLAFSVDSKTPSLQTAQEPL